MIKKVLSTIFVSVFSNALSFLILILSARYFGPTGRGVIAYIISISYFLGLLFSFTVGRTFLYFIQQEQKKALDFYKENFANLFLIIGIGFIFCVIGLFGIAQFNHNQYALNEFDYICTIGLSFSFLWQGYAKWIFSSIDKISFMNQTTFIPNIFILIFLFLNIHFHLGLDAFIAVFAGFNFLISIIQGVYLVYLMRPQWRINFHKINVFLKKALILHLDSMGGYLFAAVYVPLSAHYLTLNEVGFLQLSQQVIAIFMLIPQVLQLFIVNRIAMQGYEKAWYFAMRLIRFGTLYSVFSIFLCFILARPLVTLVFGQAFLGTVPLIKLLSVTIVGNFLATIMNPFWIAKGLLKELAILTVIFGVLGMGIALFLLTKVGIYGIVIGLIINYTAALVGNLIFIKFNKNRQGSFSCRAQNS